MVPSLALAQDAQTAPAAIPANDSATPPAAVPASDATVAANAAPVIIKYTVRVDAPGDLKELLEDNLDLERFRDSPRMTREQLFRLVRAAPEQIRTLVSTSGYYTPEVSVTFDRAATPAVVDVKVVPGEPVRVGETDLVLEGFAPNPEQPADKQFDATTLKASWPLKKGAVFRQDEWEGAKRAILRQVVQTRYPRAQLTDSRATVDPEEHVANLRVVLDSGPEMRFGDLRIEGLKRYPDTVVRNLNPIKPGDYYSEAALQAYQSKLQDTGYFASVEVSADLSAVLDQQLATADGAPTDPDAPTIAAATAARSMEPLPLLVRVTENKRKNVSAGVGISTNTGNRASLTYDDLQVFGLRMKSALTLETKKQTAKTDLYFPITPEGYNHSIGVTYERSDIAGEVTAVSSIAGKRAWGTPLLERSFTLELLSETKSVDNIPKTTSKSLPLTYAVTWRRLDNLLLPTKGYAINAQIGGAVLPVLTDEKFVRGYLRGVYYKPFGASSNIILRAEAGALGSGSKNGVPSVFLFRAGGDQSVRGYAYQELGVKEGDATIGGRYLATASAEYQYWFKPTWGAAVFYDAGNAGDRVKDLHPKSGYGVGARWKSPVGPLNVDVAYGHAVQKYRLHFSLGFTF
ncbi:autotransporter assembly complex protein TamA [Duganella phyllosphaerae]|uniref:Translocation and assembly module subunit TamA n=1 Tax=Duganella phyllosphaerae TaxID=762836 RepID=A0A1E7WYA0_9BURK|nr:autotransporter assembly complex family protein [Duganella phyllosphaerae]OFA04739.1 translocation and assembly module TamA precursor [Duganella phyllosphaerae]